VRKVQVPSADEQRAKIRQILGILEKESEEPTKDQVEESELILQNIHSIIPDYIQFIASSFPLHYPAWHELLKDSRRKSARTVLSWLKNGFRVERLEQSLLSGCGRDTQEGRTSGEDQ
jgi:hypothetical protein